MQWKDNTISDFRFGILDCKAFASKVFQKSICQNFNLNRYEKTNGIIRQDNGTVIHRKSNGMDCKRSVSHRKSNGMDCKRSVSYRNGKVSLAKGNVGHRNGSV
jgi:hypothetical protein